MQPNTTTNWTIPDPYLRSLAGSSRLGTLLRLLAAMIIALEAASLRRREEREVRRLAASMSHLPAYLRRDIGLPPG